VQESEYKRLSRDLLIDHMDGKKIKFPARRSAMRRIARELVERQYLEAIGNPVDPAFTIVTEKGRARLSKLLAAQADDLTAAMNDYVEALAKIGLHSLAGQVAAARWPFRSKLPPIEQRATP
jgi:hypothetical protein